MIMRVFTFVIGGGGKNHLSSLLGLDIWRFSMRTTRMEGRFSYINLIYSSYPLLSVNP